MNATSYFLNYCKFWQLSYTFILYDLWFWFLFLFSYFNIKLPSGQRPSSWISYRDYFYQVIRNRWVSKHESKARCSCFIWLSLWFFLQLNLIFLTQLWINVCLISWTTFCNLHNVQKSVAVEIVFFLLNLEKVKNFCLCENGIIPDLWFCWKKQNKQIINLFFCHFIYFLYL